MLQRKGVIEMAKRKLRGSPVLCILGPRQIGKTTLAKALIENQEALYLDLESPADMVRLSDPESFLLSQSNKLVVIDEVQRMPELFPILRSVIDRNRENGKFILLGSASPHLLAKSSETLAGRVSFMELQPLNLTEVPIHDTYSKLWLRGGFPHFYLNESDEESFENRVDFLASYIERDLPLLGLQISPRILRNALLMLVQLNGNLLNISDLGKSLGLDQRKVREMLDYLENAFLIRLLPPYFLNISKRLVKSPKVFFKDTGLLHASASVESLINLDGFLHRGASFEAFVIQQVISVLKTTVSTYFYRTHDGTELDLVLVKGSTPVLGLEIKTSNAPKITKGTTIAAADLGNIPVLIVTPSVQDPYFRSPNQKVLGLHDLFEELRAYALIE